MAWGGEALNIAVTVRAWVIVTVHVPVPEHPSPLQPAKVKPAAGVAVRVTCVPLTMGVLVHVLPQVIPPTLEVIVPVPEPVLLTLKE
jgi:hypothetical protein